MVELDATKAATGLQDEKPAQESWESALDGDDEELEQAGDPQDEGCEAEDQAEESQPQKAYPKRVKMLKDIDAGGMPLNAGEIYPAFEKDGLLWIPGSALGDASDDDSFELQEGEYEEVPVDEAQPELVKDDQVESQADPDQQPEAAAPEAEQPKPQFDPSKPANYPGNAVGAAHDHFARELQEAQEELSNAVLARVALEAELKDAKATEKEAVKALTKLMARGPEVLPLIDAPKKQESLFDQSPGNDQVPAVPSGSSDNVSPVENAPAAEADAGESAAADNQDAQPAEAEGVVEDESWRLVKIADLNGISSAIARSLEENPKKPIVTVGDLNDWTEEMGQKGCHSPLTEIPKIGKGKAEKIEEALAAFWSSRAKGAAQVD